jgi:dTDP-L-rhamnose 4-epimerase
MLALESDRADYEIMNVGTGRSTSIKEIAKLIARGLGKNIAPEVTEQFREGDIRHCVADISKIRSLLGYEPKVTLEDGLAELLDWVGRQQADDRLALASAELAARQLVK